MPRISVIMGIYNCQNTLSTAIESVLSQTYTDWELIMCDDGSTDDTYEIAKSYASRYENILLLKNETNQKLAATLNRCLEKASGEYIARMDADDESLPTRFEEEVAFLDSHPDIQCVGTGILIFDDTGNKNNRLYPEHPTTNFLIHTTPFAHPTIMMRKSAFDALNGYTSSPDTLRAEDVDLWFRFFEKGFKGYSIQKALYRYRESRADFQKRSMKAAVGTTKVCLRGYRRLSYPFYYYPYAFKPIAVALIPKGLLYIYHAYMDRKSKIHL